MKSITVDRRQLALLGFGVVREDVEPEVNMMTAIEVQSTLAAGKVVDERSVHPSLSPSSGGSSSPFGSSGASLNTK